MVAKQSLEAFEAERKRLNEIVLSHAGKNTKRFFSLDTAVYREGALPAQTKEMLGLVASLVLRCDACIRYHLAQCYRQEVSDEVLEEIISVALIVGGSITIPHIRKALEFWDQLKK